MCIRDRPLGTQEMIFYPTNKIRLPVNKENVIKSGLVKPKDYDLIVPFIDIDLPEGGMTKNQIVMLDILANNDWERPIYFTGGSYADSEYIWMKEYLQLEGLVYKLVPIRTPMNSNNPYIMGRLDSDSMYDIVMQWSWGNSESTSIYHDPETRKNSISFRSNMARLAEKLIDEGKNKKAKEVLDLAVQKMPLDYFGYYSLVVPMIDTYYRLGDIKSAQDLAAQIAEKYRDEMEYFSSLKASEQYFLGEEIITQAERYRTLMEAILVNKDKIQLNKSLIQFLEAIKPFINLYGEYEFYTSLSMFVEGFYITGNKAKAQNLIEDIVQQYEGRFAIIAEYSQNNQKLIFDRIKEEVLDFQQLVYIVKEFDQDLADSLQIRFDKSMGLFELEENLN